MDPGEALVKREGSIGAPTGGCIRDLRCITPISPVISECHSHAKSSFCFAPLAGLQEGAWTSRLGNVQEGAACLLRIEDVNDGPILTPQRRGGFQG